MRKHFFCIFFTAWNKKRKLGRRRRIGDGVTIFSILCKAWKIKKKVLKKKFVGTFFRSQTLYSGDKIKFYPNRVLGTRRAGARRGNCVSGAGRRFLRGGQKKGGY
jgi:hypothetical protein